MTRSLAWFAVVALLPLAFGHSYDEWKEKYDAARRGRVKAKDGLGWFVVRPTHGEPIPLPQSMKTSNEQVLTLIPTQFEIIPIGVKCDILSYAIDRYFQLILQGERAGGGYPYDYVKTAACEEQPMILHKLYIDVGNACGGGIYPTADSDESYTLEVTGFGAVLKATEIWGALRGLETFSQLVYTDPVNQCLQMKQTQIKDFPRFSYRGILIDTGRHFLTKVRSEKTLFPYFTVPNWYLHQPHDHQLSAGHYFAEFGCHVLY